MHPGSRRKRLPKQNPTQPIFSYRCSKTKHSKRSQQCEKTTVLRGFLVRPGPAASCKPLACHPQSCEDEHASRPAKPAERRLRSGWATKALGRSAMLVVSHDLPVHGICELAAGVRGVVFPRKPLKQLMPQRIALALLAPTSLL